MKTVKHPELPVTLTFDPTAHTYTDDKGVNYTPATSFVKRYFEPFDEATAAARIAKREGRLEMDVLKEWHDKRDASASYGTTVHAYAEAVIMGWPPPTPSDADQRRAFKIVDKALVMLAEHYEFLGAEQIIFDPLFEVAGTIDLPARNRKTGALAPLDWKTCESITDDNYGMMARAPIQHVRDSKVSHYALQLSLYGWLLTDPDYSAYPSAGEPVETALIHIPHIGDDPVWRPVPYMAKEIKTLLLGSASRCK